MINDGHRCYLEQREHAEREAAKRATCPEARRAHQELAQLYGEARRRANGLAAEPQQTIAFKLD